MKIILKIEPEEFGAKGLALGEQIANEADKVLQLVLKKNVSYGDAWRRQGWMGNLGRILSKSARLQNMLWGDLNFRDDKEPVEETARDLIALCIFFLLNRGQQNRWGARSYE